MEVGTVSYDTVVIRKVIRRIPVGPNGKLFTRIALAFLLLCVIVIAFFSIRFYLDCRSVVESHLKSQTWALPSTIYADAPILYEGMPMKPARLIEYLQRLDYQSTKDSSVGAGQFSVQAFDVRFRKHSLFDDAAAEPPVLVHFDKTTIESIRNLTSGEDLPAYELEPIAISNLFGEEWEKRTLVKYKDLPK